MKQCKIARERPADVGFVKESHIDRQGHHMLGIVIGAVILGGIITVMERDEFPGWGPMILCVLAAIIPAELVNYFLTPNQRLIGLAVGAVCAGFAISAACGMTVKRASIAAGIFLVLDSMVPYALKFLTS